MSYGHSPKPHYGVQHETHYEHHPEPQYADSYHHQHVHSESSYLDPYSKSFHDPEEAAQPTEDPFASLRNYPWNSNKR